MADQQAIYSPRVTHNKTAHTCTTMASQGDYVIKSPEHILFSNMNTNDLSAVCDDVGGKTYLVSHYLRALCFFLIVTRSLSF